MERFTVEKLLGKGTYGNVYLAEDHVTGKKVALKQLKVMKETVGLHFTLVREISILQELHHDNIVRILSIVTDSKKSISIAYELMETDLEKIIYNQDYILTPSIIKAYMKMIFQALHCCHSNFILHRDLKPENLLVAQDNTLKLGDFGFARFYGESGEQLSYEVCSPYYRPPELLFGSTQYSSSVDMWSAGCIMAEMMQRAPLFVGKDEIDQLSKIFFVLGTPKKEEWPGVGSLPSFVKFTPREPMPLQAIFPAASEDAIDLLSQLLKLDPRKRITAREALKHRYFSSLPEAARNEDLPSPNKKTEIKTGDGMPELPLVTPLPPVKTLPLFS
ncbi:Cyclin-dependent kinase 7 [Monocercomonoides exilis]|uniref:Cyclin-dependent kinase 7 n=1 Tax=Monocercomonoides exilis TaxID=2049356 RepID=UPI00355A7DAF|nr:Cyclin-dependent kinase 7 [Monocercomonoides exilis]|eukprot:MONOS_367.1-p1 / transcript=MONOS_367.1 / gene=MONOS_367 / organism=Monocercomonoides_exilis_PA203 / gene_product=Cyclin-dependent kinase 7 / transcript_product=Cyclin-dependent kinase 7 / location=Mono_scaffold00006:66955-68215(-) / protein_length=332 / sequence_SO=supercontig / SO=protein_coding / is_pseudo=false